MSKLSAVNNVRKKILTETDAQKKEAVFLSLTVNSVTNRRRLGLEGIDSQANL